MSKRSAQKKLKIWIVLPVIFIVFFLIFAWLGTKDGVPILMYHFIGTKAEAKEDSLVVSKETFEKQIDLLKKWGYRIYSLDEFYEFRTQNKKPPQKGVVLTFDDGNRSFNTHVASLAVREEIPVANFLILDNLTKAEKGSMSIKEARMLSKNPWVTLGAHTDTHPALVGLSDEILEKEIVASKKKLEHLLDQPMNYFAYPGGVFDDAALRKVTAAGYKLGFTTSRRRLEHRSETDHSLVRVKITEKDSNFFRFWAKVSGFYDWLKALK